MKILSNREDEIKTAKSLARLIQSIYPEANVIDTLQRVKSAVTWFGKNKDPDLVFMDIQFADGLSFEIFKKVGVNAPVIFCAAFNQYAVLAFKSNGID